MTSESTTRQEQLRTDLESLRLDREVGKPVSKSRRRRGWGKYVIAVLAVLAVIAGWRVMNRETPVQVAQATTAKASEIGPEPVLSGSGYVVTGDRYVSIGVRVPGRIDRYYVEEGQSVKQNDKLVQLDDRDYQASVKSTEAALTVARANLALA